MSATQFEISEILGQLRDMSPAGYALGFQIKYTTPKFMFQTYPKSWLDHYSKSGLLMQDPTVGWGFENTGVIRWEALKDNDPAGVIQQAAEYGAKFGITCAQESPGAADGVRSIGSFSRGDHGFSDADLTEIMQLFDKLHEFTAEHAQLPEETVKQLKNMSILVTHPSA